MPESRHRKINRARKRPRVAPAHPTTANVSSSGGISQRTILIVVIATVAIAASAAVYYFYFMKRSSPEIVYELTTPTGLKIHDARVGDGLTPKLGQSVRVNYIGWLENGKEFENSYKAGKPATFRLGEVIPGWNEALSTMKAGGERWVYIPSNLGYGAAGNPPKIPPDSNLKFKIELLEVK